MASKILITGGFGFIGGHLLAALAGHGHRLHVVDNLTSNPLPVDVLLGELGEIPGLQWEEGDVEAFCRGYDGPDFDQIYHLASFVGPAGVLRHAGRIADAIVRQLDAVSELTERCRAKLVFVSTSEVYGGGQDGYCSEDTPKIVAGEASARLEYALGKLAGETALINRCRVNDLRATIIRPFNVSGPRQSGRGGFVLPRFVGQALEGLALTVFGDGSQLRAFTHVCDVVDGLVLAMERGVSGKVYNLGNPENKCSILQLAQEVLEESHGSSTIQFVDPKTIYGPFYEEASDKFPDARRMRDELGWCPSRDRRRTIRETFAYMDSLPRPLLESLRGF